MLETFFRGFGYVVRGKKIAKEVPRINVWILIPFLLDVLLLGLGVYFGAGLVQVMAMKSIAWMFGGADTIWAQIVYVPLIAVLILGFVVILIYAVYVLASVIASPFYGIIAEKTLVHLGVIQEQPFQLGRVLRQALSMFLVSLKRALILGLIGVVLFVLSFIPVLNLFAAYVAFILMAMDSADFSFEARALGVSERFRFLRANLQEFMGMGAFVGLTLLVPGLILLIMPYAVIGAADMVKRNAEKVNG